VLVSAGGVVEGGQQSSKRVGPVAGKIPAVTAPRSIVPVRNAVLPCLRCRNAPRAIDFLVDGFGFEITG